MIAATVAPSGVRSIARMRACLVLGVEVFGDECADRERGLDFLVVRAAVRVEAWDLDFDLDLVIDIHPDNVIMTAEGPKLIDSVTTVRAPAAFALAHIP